jgi:methylated-DNA-protein-cysteine methyltransferase-like protein
MVSTFHQRVIEMIKRIPRGKVAAYGQIATMAGDPRGARQVVRILHTSSEKQKLPWHRVINRLGCISLRPGHGYELQKALLEREGVVFDGNDNIDLKRFLWRPLK